MAIVSCGLLLASRAAAEEEDEVVDVEAEGGKSGLGLDENEASLLRHD